LALTRRGWFYGRCCRWYRKYVGVVAVILAVKGSGRAVADVKRASLPAIPRSISAEHEQWRGWRDRCQSLSIADQRPDVDPAANAGVSSVYPVALIATETPPSRVAFCLMRKTNVMAGHSRPKDGVASARLCPGHLRLCCGGKTWMPGTSPGMTKGSTVYWRRSQRASKA
jgi:hypothetical protein